MDLSDIRIPQNLDPEVRQLVMLLLQKIKELEDRIEVLEAGP